MRLIARTAALAAAIALLVGCGRELPAPAEPSTPTPAAEAASAAPITTLEAAIPAEQIATRLELVGSPRYAAGSDTLELVVRVHNDGQATLVGAGAAMVNLGAMLVGPDGPDVAPGVRDFIRAPLPVTVPGSQVEVPMSLPAAALLGLPIRLELVQEGVSWFGNYGQPSLDIGAFQRCGGAEGSLCDADGQAVAQ